ncbi:CidA/LrgA family protein [Cellulophaga sp. F20128]|uniref:CidA/LrgA family protein n=1 Tax=Cellulophaga sp. F20128 TaxID=2926413 RepID=UPI001FF3E5CF|nr:CidA/LrgA family protein [Cellulophaga sp. F20128]MCK0158307.1 CidA/LrgA family protein [Cellulophaga sp. F20128]
MFKGVLYIFLFLVIGEIIVYLFNLSIAGNIVGMVAIFIALKFKIIQLKDVKPASDQFIKYMVLFFVPYGVGLMAFYDILKMHWIAIVVGTVLSTILTLYITAIVLQKFGKNE